MAFKFTLPEPGDIEPARTLANALPKDVVATAVARYTEQFPHKCQICGGRLWDFSAVRRRVWYSEDCRNYIHAKYESCLLVLRDQIEAHTHAGAGDSECSA